MKDLEISPGLFGRSPSTLDSLHFLQVVFTLFDGEEQIERERKKKEKFMWDAFFTDVLSFRQKV